MVEKQETTNKYLLWPDPTGCLSHGGSVMDNNPWIWWVELGPFLEPPWHRPDNEQVEMIWLWLRLGAKVGSIELVTVLQGAGLFFYSSRGWFVLFAVHFSTDSPSPKQRRLTYFVGIVCIKSVRCFTFFQQRKYVLIQFYSCMGVSLNGATPISHPKMIIFSRKIHGCWEPPF